jgi:hypothetical protein
MSEKLQRNFSVTLWVLTGVILGLFTLQGLSGNWITYFLILPGGPSNFSQVFIGGLIKLAQYHKIMGFAIGGVSVLVLIFAFLRKSTMYVRVFAVLGFVITSLAVIGGYLFFKSEFQDRWALGQMADAFIGAYAAYFVQLFFMNGTPNLCFIAKGS